METILHREPDADYETEECYTTIDSIVHGFIYPLNHSTLVPG